MIKIVPGFKGKGIVFAEKRRLRRSGRLFCLETLGAKVLCCGTELYVMSLSDSKLT